MRIILLSLVAEGEPRNQIYDISVQILNGLFTYMATVAMPWRCSNAVHVFGCGARTRDNSDGKDLYGFDSQDVWFHIPICHRRNITVILLLNCFCQYFNQATRIVFWSYKLQDHFPGNLWTNLFFVASMLFAAVGALYLVVVEGRVRKLNPGKFKPGPIQQLSAWWKSKRQPDQNSAAAAAAIEMPSRRDILRDQTQNKYGSVLGSSGESVRGGLRMFAL
jgi:hypothetical protein